MLESIMENGAEIQGKEISQKSGGLS